MISYIYFQALKDLHNLQSFLLKNSFFFQINNPCVGWRLSPINHDNYLYMSILVVSVIIIGEYEVYRTSPVIRYASEGKNYFYASILKRTLNFFLLLSPF